MISGSYTVTKKKKTEISQMLVPTAIILILGSVFIALFLLAPMQSLLYDPKGDWFFEPPKTAYYAFIGAILIVALLLITTAVFLYKESLTILVKMILTIGYVLSFIVLLLSINQYHYVSQSGIVINRFLSINEEEYTWNDIKSAEEVFHSKNGIMSSGEIKFTFSNGKSYSFLLNENVRKAKIAMYFELEKSGIEVKRDED